MTTDADKIRYLVGLAGWRAIDEVTNRWVDRTGRYWGWLPDYPNSLDDIARDLLPLLREKGWTHQLNWTNKDYWFFVSKPLLTFSASSPAPARAAFEAIWQALHGGEE